MREFFKGWRRKFGCITLLMACVFMGGWVRSWSHKECVQIPLSKTSSIHVGSTDHVLGFAYHTDCDPSENQFDFWSHFEEGKIDEVLSIDGNGPLGSDGSDMEWRILCGNLAMGRSEYLPDFVAQYSFAVVPYWPIVMSLALLSTALLFSKTRLSKEKTSTEKNSADPTSDKRVAHFGRFINGWQRKTGLVTLVMACVFAGFWISSYWYGGEVMELVRRHNQHDLHDRLVSFPGEIVWAQARNLNASQSFTEFFGSMSLGNGESPYGDLVCAIPITWRWNLIGLRYGDGLDAEGDNACSIITVPYRLVVIPLILISAFLLLSKSSKSTSKKAVEPAQIVPKRQGAYSQKTDGSATEEN